MTAAQWQADRTLLTVSKGLDGAFLVLVAIVVLSSPALADLFDLIWLKIKIWLGI